MPMSHTEPCDAMRTCRSLPVAACLHLVVCLCDCFWMIYEVRSSLAAVLGDRRREVVHHAHGRIGGIALSRRVTFRLLSLSLSFIVRPQCFGAHVC